MGYSMNDLYPSKWLKAEDLKEGEERVLTIKDFSMEELGQGAKAEQKPCLHFRDGKPLILNKTNASIIANLYGNDTDDWFGKRITVFTAEVDSFGDIVRAIRVRNKVPTGPASAPTEADTGDPFGASTSPITNEQKVAITSKASQLWPDRAAMIEGVKTLWSGNVNDLSSEQADEVIKKLDQRIANSSTPMMPDEDDDPFGP